MMHKDYILLPVAKVYDSRHDGLEAQLITDTYNNLERLEHNETLYILRKKDEPIIRNFKVDRECLDVGNYVFASKYSDCDYNDPWAIGFISSFLNGRVILSKSPTEYVPIDGVGERPFNFAMRISEDDGVRILNKYPKLEGTDVDFKIIYDIFSGN